MRYYFYQLTFVFSVNVLRSHHMNVKREELIKDLKEKNLEGELTRRV